MLTAAWIIGGALMLFLIWQVIKPESDNDDDDED
jgi:hypothetical protein